MVAKKSYDQNQILKETAALRGRIGNITAVPQWVTIILDPGWSTLTSYAPPSYRYWQDGIHIEFTGAASWGSASTTNQTLNANNPLPIAPLTTKSIVQTSGNYNVGGNGFAYISNNGVITMRCTSSFTGSFIEINGVFPLDL
jgi:hypothetical protein